MAVQRAEQAVLDCEQEVGRIQVQLKSAKARLTRAGRYLRHAVANEVGAHVETALDDQDLHI